MGTFETDARSVWAITEHESVVYVLSRGRPGVELPRRLLTLLRTIEARRASPYAVLSIVWREEQVPETTNTNAKEEWQEFTKNSFNGLVGMAVAVEIPGIAGKLLRTAMSTGLAWIRPAFAMDVCSDVSAAATRISERFQSAGRTIDPAQLVQPIERFRSQLRESRSVARVP